MNKWVVRKITPASLGAYACDNNASFAADTVNCDTCSLLLYKTGSETVEAEIPMKLAGERSNICGIEIMDFDSSQYEYNFRMDKEVVTDPYASALAGRSVWGKPAEPRHSHAVRARVRVENFDWGEDYPLVKPYSECVMYSLHVRGFTKDPSSRVKHKGTFLGILEKLPYITDLGVNQIELSPCYDFQEVMNTPGAAYYPNPETNSESAKPVKLNYWGYAPGYYFAPKASYCGTNDPVNEFKTLVKGLHDAGVELVLDFHFVDNTNPVLIQDCLRYWVEEYHVDGFHISGQSVPIDVLTADPRLRDTKIIADWFDEEKIKWDWMDGRHLAEFNDGFKNDIRRFLKGDEDQLSNFTYRLNRHPKGWSVINYVAGEQGFTLMDLVSYDTKHNEDNGEQNQDGTNFNYSWNCGAEGPSRKKSIIKLRTRLRKNALLITILSQGTPMILAGDEFGNTKYGNNNAYCQDNKVSWLNWNDLNRKSSLYEYTKYLIAFRAKHPILRARQEFKQYDYLSCGYPDLSYHGRDPWYPEFENYNRQIGIMYRGEYARTETGSDDSFYFGYNMHWIPHEFPLPALHEGKEWKVIFGTDDEESAENLLTEEKGRQTLLVTPRSVVVLAETDKTADEE